MRAASGCGIVRSNSDAVPRSLSDSSVRASFALAHSIRHASLRRYADAQAARDEVQSRTRRQSSTECATPGDPETRGRDSTRRRTASRPPRPPARSAQQTPADRVSNTPSDRHRTERRRGENGLRRDPRRPRETRLEIASPSGNLCSNTATNTSAPSPVLTLAAARDRDAVDERVHQQSDERRHAHQLATRSASLRRSGNVGRSCAA